MSTQPLSFSLRRAAVAFALLGTLLVATLAPACSSSSKCVDSKCAAGNRCLDDGTGSACRLLCDSQSVCPFNYHCTTIPNGTQAYCAADTTKYEKKDKGQWGAPCSPSGGLDSNPDCASDQSFWCYGRTPTDGAAYCTQYQCATDADCAGGYWCATIDAEPSVRNPKRTFGATTTVCLKRDYCATCKADVDCPPIFGVKTHCIAGSDRASFCAPECQNDGNCNPDAKCAQNDVAGGSVCTPRAGTCKGDGALCSPCRSDADCTKGGFCIYESYSHERFCSEPSPTPCTVDGATNKLSSGCPKTDQAMGKISCETNKDNPVIPKDQCIGIVEFGTDPSTGGPSYNIGCWAVNVK